MTSFDWINQGQLAMDQGNYLDALSCHQQALTRAQSNCRQTLGINPEAALNSVLDCWLLIARSCAELGMVKSVAAVAMRAEGFVVDQLLESRDSDDQLVQACDRSFQRFRSRWTSFTRDYAQANLPEVGRLDAWQLPCRSVNPGWISGGLH